MWIVSTIANIMDIRIEYLTIIPRARMGSESIRRVLNNTRTFRINGTFRLK